MLKHTKSKYQTRAEENFRNGYNCSQAVLSAFADDFDLTEQQCCRLGTAFGAGMAQQKTCGAISGALMALGMLNPKAGSSDPIYQAELRHLTKTFQETWSKSMGSCDCRWLLGWDISTPEGLEEARRRDIFNDRCTLLVFRAAGELFDFVQKESGS